MNVRCLDPILEDDEAIDEMERDGTSEAERRANIEQFVREQNAEARHRRFIARAMRKQSGDGDTIHGHCYKEDLQQGLLDVQEQERLPIWRTTVERVNMTDLNTAKRRRPLDARHSSCGFGGFWLVVPSRAPSLGACRWRRTAWGAQEQVLELSAPRLNSKASWGRLFSVCVVSLFWEGKSPMAQECVQQVVFPPW